MLRTTNEGDVMTNAKHAPEPWVISEDSENDILSESYGKGNGWYEVAAPVSGSGNDDDAQANAERIVACVNACEGIDPEAVPAMLEALKAAKTLLKLLDDVDKAILSSQFASETAEEIEDVIQAATVTP